MRKKAIVISIVLIIIILIGVITILYFKERGKYEYKLERVTEINYHIINKDERYGVIDRKGNVVIEPTYDIIQIPNPSKAIFICMSDYNTEKREYKIKIFNENKEELYQGYSQIQAIPNETADDNVPFEKTVLKYKRDGKYGLININGKEITKPVYDEISSISYKEGMLLVKQEEKQGIININGTEVIPTQYYSVTADNYYSETTKYKTTGFIVSKKTEDGYKYGYINYKGKKILDTIYTEVERVNEIEDNDNVYLVALKDGQAGLLKNTKEILNYEYEDISYNSYNDVFIIQRNGKQGIVDRQGTQKIPTEYDNILFGGIYINAEKDGKVYTLDLEGKEVKEKDILQKVPTSDGKHYIISDKNEIYKIVDKDGNIVINKGYSYIEEIKENYYIVASGNLNGIINLTGINLVILKYNSIFKLDGTEMFQANISDTSTVALINKEMKVIASMDNAGIKVEDGYILMYSYNGNKYFDYQGNELDVKQVYPNNQLYAKQIQNKWGFVNKDGDIKVEANYDRVTEFNKYGFAGIQENGLWGVINSEGNIIQEPIYEIDEINPEFIGKYYKQSEWYGDLYYTDKIKD